MPRSRSPTMVDAPMADEMVSGTTTAIGANRYTASTYCTWPMGAMSGMASWAAFGSSLERLGDALDGVVAADHADDAEQEHGDDDEEEAAEQHHRDPEVLGLEQLAQVGAGHDPHARPVEAVLAGHGAGRRAVRAAVRRSGRSWSQRCLHAELAPFLADGEVEVLERRLVRVDPGQAHARPRPGRRRGRGRGARRRPAPRSSRLPVAVHREHAVHRPAAARGSAGSSASNQTSWLGQ